MVIDGHAEGGEMGKTSRIQDAFVKGKIPGGSATASRFPSEYAL
jgi:hypothetical protein